MIKGHKWGRMLIYTIALNLVFSCTHGALSKEDKNLIQKHSIKNIKVKEFLDEVFKSTSNIHEALKAAQFTFLKEENQIVAEHPMLEGLLIKALPDATFKNSILAHDLNLRRVEMAEAIRNVIRKDNLKYVIVPNKYIYHIPGTKMELNDKNFIVLSEKLNLINVEENRKLMRNLTYEQKEEVFKVIEKVGLFDARCTNIVITRNGKIAFIDTEPRWNFKIPLLSGLIRKIASRKGARRFYHDITRDIDSHDPQENSEFSLALN